MTMTEQNNLGKLITWCQNWLIVTNRATNAKDFEILGRAIVGCSMIVEHPDGSITNGYSYLNRKNSNATWRAGELIDGAIREWKIMVGGEMEEGVI